MNHESILIVEDDAIISMRLESALGGWGYQTASVPSGEEALEIATGRHFDLALMDIRLDGQMDGIQAAQELHTRLGLPSVFLTAYADDELIERAQLAEPYGYLIKPVSERELKSTIRMALYKFEMEHRIRAEEQRGRALIDKSFEVIVLLDRSDHIQFASPSVARVLGYRPEDILGGNGYRFVHPAERRPLWEAFNPMIAAPGASAVAQAQMRHKDGSYRWIELIATNLLDEPAVQAVVVNMQDITARKQTELLLQKQIDRLTALRAIDIAINSSIDLRVMLQILLEQVLPQLQADASDVLLLNPTLLTLEPVAARGFQSDAFGRAVLRLGDSLAGQAVLRQRLVSVDDLQHPAAKIPAPLAAAVRREGFITYHAVPLVVKGMVKGVLEVFHRAPFQANDDWVDFLQALSGQAALAIDNATMFQDLQRSHTELVVAYDTTIEGWSRALDMRDKETEGHSQRVAAIALVLAGALGVSPADQVQVRRGALLHDIGKMGVPDHILLKPEPLSGAEWEIMRAHPTFARALLAPIDYLRGALDIPYCHHEKWDGSGYPRGLRGADIPLAARLFAVVDVWDALTHNRPYRQSWTYLAAIEYLRAEAGRHFDPAVVEVFLRLLDSGEIEYP